MLCILRRLRDKDDDGINSFISGFLGGLSLLVHNDKETRKMYALYLIARAYDAGYHSLEEKKIIPSISNGALIFCLIVNIQFIYIYFCHREWLPRSTYTILHFMYGVHKDPNDPIFEDIITQICSKAANY